MLGTVLAIPFPPIDPVLVHLGPLPIRWYSLAYIAGLLLGWWVVMRALKRGEVMFARGRLQPSLEQERQKLEAKERLKEKLKARLAELRFLAQRNQLDSLVIWVMLGVVLGGRIGYVLFYQWEYYAAHPAAIFQVWQGGMSFHGGMIGSVLAVYLFCRHHREMFFRVMDWVALVAPIGLGLGRVANFINAELFGRVTDAPWGVIFPGGGPSPRHPSQLYEAFAEGLLLFLLLWVAMRFFGAMQKPGRMSGLFLMGYAIARISCEFFREPDLHLGFIWGVGADWGGITMGQILSVPMLLLGLFVWRVSAKRGTHSGMMVAGKEGA